MGADHALVLDGEGHLAEVGEGDEQGGEEEHAEELRPSVLVQLRKDITESSTESSAGETQGASKGGWL